MRYEYKAHTAARHRHRHRHRQDKLAAGRDELGYCLAVDPRRMPVCCRSSSSDNIDGSLKVESQGTIDSPDNKGRQVVGLLI